MANTFFSSPAMLTWLLLLFTPTALSVKIYLCGDSTMAKSPDNIIHGWGEKFPPYVSVPVVNKAMGGRSARSYTVQKRFQEVLTLALPGDVVIISFGHNDPGSLKVDNGRTDCPGAGTETCKTTFQGQPVIVKTFPAYLTEAGVALVAKGAKVVFSSMTPNNIWEGGSGTYVPTRFTEYARQAALAVGEGATFVDHGLYVAKAYKALGATKVNSFYMKDHTHTNEAGAQVVAQAFVKAVMCAQDVNLMPYMKTSVPPPKTTAPAIKNASPAIKHTGLGIKAVVPPVGAC